MHIHFIAIGGNAMHNLALELQEQGHVITGSDDAIFDPSRSRLKKAGLLPAAMGWYPEKISPALDAVILGMHAKADNPELLKAQELGLRIYSYPEFLYEQSKDKTRVVIGGSHGKTTITSMILHVMHFYGRQVDFMVGAQLEGFNRMVHITRENKYMVLEGDEYLTSPIDRRPKFHVYQPVIALLSGIAWDHINVFPTFDNYVEQFKIFVDTIVEGGAIVYNIEDEQVKKVVEDSSKNIRRYPYRLPQYEVRGDKTVLKSEGKEYELYIFGKHNLSNLAGAQKICALMGIEEDYFYKAVKSFKGAAKRLEKIAENQDTVIFKDYAHSPSKVKATTEAVRLQYPNKKVLACLELHTYSSLNAGFLDHYQGALDAADEALVFYSPEAVKIKRLENIDAQYIKDAFARDNLQVFTDPKSFKNTLKTLDLKDTVLLLMSSGDYGGLDFDEVSRWI